MKVGWEKCLVCGGSGTAFYPSPGDNPPYEARRCPACGGRGKIRSIVKENGR